MPNIDIKIRRKRPVRRLTANHKPPIDIRREADYLKRRLRPKGINFYELGQISDGHGGWTYNDVSVPVTPSFAGDQIFQSRDPITADYTTIDSVILAAATGDLKSVFRKFVKGSTMSVNWGLQASFGAFGGFIESLPQWTSGGLIVEQSDLDSGLFVETTSFPLTTPFTALDIPDYKITHTPVFSDPAVAFTPSPLMDIFLAPSLASIRIYFSWVTALGEIHRDAEYTAFVTMPRPWITDPGNPYYSAFNDSHPDSYTTSYLILQAVETFPDRTTYTQHVTFGGSYSATGSFANGPTLTVPPTLPPIDPTAGGSTTTGLRFFSYDSLGAFAVFMDSAIFIPPSGVLVAIVVKNGVSYYFWGA